jgi:hypothetical protein
MPYMRLAGALPKFLLHSMMPSLSCRCFLNRFHMPSGSNDLLNLSVGRLGVAFQLRTLLLLCPLQGEGLPRKDKNEGGHPALYEESQVKRLFSVYLS